MISNKEITKKSCFNCEYEPDWQVDKNIKIHHKINALAGRCKFPIPFTLAPYLCMDDDARTLKGSDGKYVFDHCLDDSTSCNAWKEKELFKIIREEGND